MRWSPSDDELLMTLVRSYTVKNNYHHNSYDEETSIEWSSIAKRFPGRSPKQCREHWYGSVNPENNKEAWTDEEIRYVEKLIEQHGTQWKIIRSLLPNQRSELAIRNMYYATQRKQARALAKQGRKLAASLGQNRTTTHNNSIGITDNHYLASSVTDTSSINKNDKNDDNTVSTIQDSQAPVLPRLTIRPPSYTTTVTIQQQNQAPRYRSNINKERKRKNISDDNENDTDSSNDDHYHSTTTESLPTQQHKYRRMVNNDHSTVKMERNGDDSEGYDDDEDYDEDDHEYIDDETGTNTALALTALFGNAQPSDLETPKVEAPKEEAKTISLQKPSSVTNSLPQPITALPTVDNSITKALVNLLPPNEHVGAHSRVSSTASMNSLVSSHGRFASSMRSNSDTILVPTMDNTVSIPSNFGITSFTPDSTNTSVNENSLDTPHNLLSNHRNTTETVRVPTKLLVTDSSPYFPPLNPELYVTQTNRGFSSNSLSSFDGLSSSRALYINGANSNNPTSDVSSSSFSSMISPSVQPFLYVSSGQQSLPWSANRTEMTLTTNSQLGTHPLNSVSFSSSSLSNRSSNLSTTQYAYEKHTFPSFTNGYYPQFHSPSTVNSWDTTTSQ